MFKSNPNLVVLGGGASERSRGQEVIRVKPSEKDFLLVLRDVPKSCCLSHHEAHWTLCLPHSILDSAATRTVSS